MERDEMKHEQIMRRIEVAIRKDQAKELARKQRFEQIQERLRQECQEQSNDDR